MIVVIVTVVIVTVVIVTVVIVTVVIVTLVCKILKIMLLRSEVTVAGIDWEEVGIYLASTHKQKDLDEAGLGEVVPRWRYRPQGGGN